MRYSIPLGLVALLGGAATPAAPADHFDDPLFRRCIDWMLSGDKGSMIDNLCLDEYDLPPPSLFLCARKVRTGFVSEVDREGCAIVFEEEARKVRAGYVK
jgi:hypothetical protein